MFSYFEGIEPGDITGFEKPRDMSSFVDPKALSPEVTTNLSTYKKSKWTPAEDRALIESVKIHGTKNWIAVASLVPERNSKQCRERWTAQLDPNLNHNEFTPQEDAVIILQHQTHGPLWAKIASFLPGRSATAVKNRFNWLSRRHLPQKMNQFLLAGTTPMNSPSGSFNSLGIAPLAFSDPAGQAQDQNETQSDGELPENAFTGTLFEGPFEPDEDDYFQF